jgi:iron complex outermembrane receptor protein
MAVALSAVALQPVLAQEAPAPPAPPASAPAVRLEPVIVTGSGIEQRAFATPYSVGVVQSDAIHAAGPMVNLSEALASVPGLSIANRNNYAQDLQISSRGFGARSTFGVRGLRLYTDGIPATMPDGQGQVTHFDLAGAQRVEVLRGPFSALYGNSSGGVIALVTGPAPYTGVEIDGDTASFGTRQARFALSSAPNNGFDVRAALSYFETEGFRPHSEAHRTLGSFRLGYSGGDEQVVVIASHIDQPAQDPLGLTRAQFDAYPYQTASQALQFDTRKTASQDQVGSQWRHRLDGLYGLSEVAVTAYLGERSVTQWQAIPVATQIPRSSPGGVIDFDRNYAGLDARLVWKWELAGARRAQVVAGAAHEEQTEARRGYENFIGTGPTQQLGVTGALRRDEVDKASTNDLYAQGEIEFLPRWVGTLGVRSGSLRYSAHDNFLSNGDDSGSLKFNYTNPVAALQWRVQDALNLYVSAGRGYESPTLAELAYRPDGRSGFNAALKAQKSKQVELGAKWRSDSMGLSADAAIFRADTDDEIGVLTNVGGRSAFQNVGRTKRQGVEIGTQWRVTPAWSTQLALTWLDARYRDDFVTCTTAPCPPPQPGACTVALCPAPYALARSGNRIAGTSPRSAYADIAWKPLDRAEIAAELRAQGRVAVNDLNSDFAAGFATIGLRTRYRIGEPASGLEALFRIDNLAGREYAGSVIVNEGNSRFFEPGAPRSFYLGLRWNGGV